jgi:transcription initiation factor TFIID subunit 1
MRTNKLCPKYGEDPETSEMDAISFRHNPLDAVSHVQTKTQGKRLVAKVSSEVPETEGPESIQKIKPVKFRCGAPEHPLEGNMSVATDLKSTGKVGKIKIFNKIKSEDYPPDTPKPSVVIRPPAEAERDIPRKKVIIKQPKGQHADQQRANEIRSGQEPRKIRRIADLSTFEKANREEDHWYAGEPSQMNSFDRLGSEGKNKVMGNDESWRAFQEQRERQEQRLIEARMYEASREEELQKAKKKSKKKKKHEFRDDDVLDHRPYRNDRKVPERVRAAKRRTPADTTEYAPSAKRRRGGEVFVFAHVRWNCALFL